MDTHISVLKSHKEQLGEKKVSKKVPDVGGVGVEGDNEKGRETLP